MIYLEKISMVACGAWDRNVTPTMIYGRRCGDTSAENVANVRAEFEEKMELQKQEMELQGGSFFFVRFSGC